MDRPAVQDVVPDFARPLATQIERRSEMLADYLEQAAHADRLRDTEAEVFSEFESFLALALDRYQPEPPKARGVGRLVFQPLYDEVQSAGTGHNSSSVLLAALLAAQLEALGPLRLTRHQATKLADLLSDLGDRLVRAGLLVHAASAYDRAARLYLEVDEYQARDRCLLQLAAVRHRALPRGFRRFAQSASGVLAGYGYQPYRLLVWMAAQLVLCGAILLLLPRPHGSRLDSGSVVFIALQDFVNPMGLGDTAGLSHWALVVLSVESYLGTISIAVFFALMLRRWFRV